MAGKRDMVNTLVIGGGEAAPQSADGSDDTTFMHLRDHVVT